MYSLLLEKVIAKLCKKKKSKKEVEISDKTKNVRVFLLIHRKLLTSER